MTDREYDIWVLGQIGRDELRSRIPGSPSRVPMWFTRGVVPDSAKPDVVRVCQELGVEIDVARFLRLPPSVAAALGRGSVQVEAAA